MGGVGGVHLLTLARFGVGGFTIADFDRFDLPNFNRQVGAMMSTLDQPKLDVLERMALDINPELRIRTFPNGVSVDGIDDFLSGADLFVDGFDFFAIDIRRKVFARCHQLGIPAITAAPAGMGTSWLIFVPNGMSFEQYFRLDGQPENEQFLRFFLGLTPKGLQRPYLVDPSRIDLAAKRGPSTAAGCQLAAGVAATAAIKLLLRRGDVKPAPFHHHFDAFVGRYVITKLPNGNAGALQQLKLKLGRRMLASKPAINPEASSAGSDDVLSQILSVARWAPSGDNDQPWSFERLGSESVMLHVRATSPANVYEYRDGEPLLLAAGMLLESLKIAGLAFKRRMTWEYEGANSDHRIRVDFHPDDQSPFDPLYGCLSQRSVDRRRFRLRPLTGLEKAKLEASLGSTLRIRWFEATAARRAIASLGAAATDIRLRARETFETHKRVVDWTRRFSPTGIPASSLGAGTAMLRMMKWQMGSWARMDRMNRLFGTRAAGLQLDIIPGIFSAAFFSLIKTSDCPSGPIGILLAGASIQRFWLTATQLGLSLQPALATVIFASLGASGSGFTEQQDLRIKAGQLADRFQTAVQVAPADCIFLGRIGQPAFAPVSSRSVRRPLSELFRS